MFQPFIHSVPVLRAQYLCASHVKPDFVVSEDMVPSQNIAESLLPSSEIIDLYELFLGIPWDTPPPQIASPADDRAEICTTYPAPTFITFPPLNWHKIPQTFYNHGQKQWDFERSESISFSVNGHPGVNMGDALHGRFTGLDGRDDLVLQDANGAISCRLSVRSS